MRLAAGHCGGALSLARFCRAAQRTRAMLASSPACRPFLPSFQGRGGLQIPLVPLLHGRVTSFPHLITRTSRLVLCPPCALTQPSVWHHHSPLFHGAGDPSGFPRRLDFCVECRATPCADHRSAIARGSGPTRRLLPATTTPPRREPYPLPINSGRRSPASVFCPTTSYHRGNGSGGWPPMTVHAWVACCRRNQAQQGSCKRMLQRQCPGRVCGDAACHRRGHDGAECGMHGRGPRLGRAAGAF
jgi:hypothetical protein